MHTTLNLGWLTTAAAFLAVALAGCGGGGGSAAGISGPQVNLPAPTGQYQAIKFTLTTDKQVYAVGEPVNATLTVTNTGSQPVYYQRAAPFVGLLVQMNETAVWDVINHPVSDIGGGTVQPTPLAPGASLTYQVMWKQVSDGGHSNDPNAVLPQVPPGQYTLRGYSVQDFYGEFAATNTWYQTNFAAPLVTITVQ